MNPQRLLKISRLTVGQGVFCLVCAWATQGVAYVEIAYTLGRVIQESTSISEVQVVKVDKERNLILFRKVRDLKGTLPGDALKHNIGRAGFHEREWKAIMEWAEPGRTAVFFNNGGASETCINNYWYQAYNGGEWWNMSHGEPYMLRSYAGTPEKLTGIVTAMVAGQETVVPCMVDGDKNALQLRTARVQRLKASLRVQDYNAQRDFVGWGGDDFHALAGMPPFSHYASLNRLDPAAHGVALADVDGDGKQDFCLYGDSRVVLMKVDGKSLSEIPLPLGTGARAAQWADYNGDGKPDLLLATPTGPKLLTNQGGTLKDDTGLLPKEAYYNVTAAAWLDYDGDKKPDLLLANGFLGLRLWRNLGELKGDKYFEDISDAAKLGTSGVGGALKGDYLTVEDVNGDGRQDFLYSAGTGLLAVNTPQGFVQADAGVSFKAGGVRPIFLDYNGDQRPDLFVPQNGASKLFANRGGKFEDVTAATGDLARGAGDATSAAVLDFDHDGRLDLLIGCFKGPNRFFLGQANGQFANATERLGLYQRTFNSRCVAFADVNKDGAPDLLLINEGQESALLLGKVETPSLSRSDTRSVPY